MVESVSQSRSNYVEVTSVNGQETCDIDKSSDPTAGLDPNDLEQVEESDDCEDPDWMVAKPTKKKNKKAVKGANVATKHDSDSDKYWRQVAKKESKRSKQLQLADGEVPTTNPDGSISFPNGYCFKEWSSYWKATRNNRGQVNKVQFIKNLLIKAFNKDLPSPIPDHVDSELKMAYARFCWNKKKKNIDRLAVCFTIMSWDELKQENSHSNSDVRPLGKNLYQVSKKWHLYIL